MVEQDEARAALGAVAQARRRVGDRLVAARPRWQATALLVLGYYLVTAGLDFEFPIPLVLMLVGLAVFGAGLRIATRQSAQAGIKGNRDTWSTRNILLTAAWIIGMYAVYTVLSRLLDGVVPEGATSALAALPAAAVCCGMVLWLWHIAYGARPDPQDRDRAA